MFFLTLPWGLVRASWVLVSGISWHWGESSLNPTKPNVKQAEPGCSLATRLCTTQHPRTPPNHCQPPDFQLLVPDKPVESYDLIWQAAAWSSPQNRVRHEHLEKDEKQAAEHLFQQSLHRV